MSGPALDGRLLAERYRLADTLGRGGMGVVWRARDELLGREVAVKEILLPPELPDQERDVLRRRTLREARSAAQLSHPNVVAMYDVVEEAGRPWIVMELIRSQTLADRIRERGALHWRDVALIGLQVLSALEAAHSAGVLHRDVKPSNVLLADDQVPVPSPSPSQHDPMTGELGSGRLAAGRVVLTDFGIATLEGDPSLTTSGTILGSPAYMAPERIQARGAGPASDLWSLGATLYTAVEGRPPYDRGAPLPTMTAAVTEAPDPMRLAGPLAPVLEGLLRKNPADRINVSEARRLLQQAAQTAVPEAAPSDAEPTPDTTAAAPAAGAADSGQQTRVLSLPPLLHRPKAVGEQSGSRPPARRGRSRGLAVAAGVVVLACVAGLGWVITRLSDDETPRGAPSTASTRAPRSTAPTTPPTSGGSRSSASPTRQSTATTSRSPSVRPSGQPSPTGSLPAGFVRHTDATGFSLAVPAGWTRTRDGQQVSFREPGGSRLLIIDQTDQPKADPVADWRQQEQARRDGYADYHRIRIEAVDYFDKAADWEFTYSGRSGRQHVVIRGVVTSPDQAYGLYWSTPDSQWEQSRAIYAEVIRSFHPAS